MSFTVNPISSAGSGAFGDLHGVVKPQRLVNWNIRISADLYNRRKSSAESPTLPEERRYGSVISSGRGMPGDLLNIHENEVIFGSRHGGAPGSWSHLSEPEAYGWQSLNGMYIPPGMNEEDLADRHPIIGISRSAYFVSPNIPEQMAHGVAAAVSGSVPLHNNSPLLRAWRPGDMLVCRWPSVDPARRREEESRKPRSDGVDPQRLTVYIEPATYVETRLYFEKELATSFEDGQAENFSARNYFENGVRPGGLTPAQRAVTTLRGTLQLAAFAAIAMLMVHSDDDAQLTANIKDPDVFARTAAGRTLDVRRANHARRDALEAALIKWAGALGCTTGLAQGSTRTDTFLVDHIVGIALKPLIMNRSTANYFDVTQLFSVNRAASARSPDGTLGVLPVPNDPVGGIVWAQGVFAPGALAALKGCIERLMNRFVARALDYTPPGGFGAVYR